MNGWVIGGIIGGVLVLAKVMQDRERMVVGNGYLGPPTIYPGTGYRPSGCMCFTDPCSCSPYDPGRLTPPEPGIVPDHPVEAPADTDATLLTKDPYSGLTLGGFKAAFGSKDGDPNYNRFYDFNADGVIDIVDYSVALAHLS